MCSMIGIGVCYVLLVQIIMKVMIDIQNTFKYLIFLRNDLFVH